VTTVASAQPPPMLKPLPREQVPGQALTGLWQLAELSRMVHPQGATIKARQLLDSLKNCTNCEVVTDMQSEKRPQREGDLYKCLKNVLMCKQTQVQLGLKHLGCMTGLREQEECLLLSRGDSFSFWAFTEPVSTLHLCKETPVTSPLTSYISRMFLYTGRQGDPSTCGRGIFLPVEVVQSNACVSSHPLEGVSSKCTCTALLSTVWVNTGHPGTLH
jgi:hypothetical protein